MRPGEVPATPTHTIKRLRARQERQRVKRAGQQLPQQRLSPIAVITQEAVMTRILRHLQLASVPPPIAPACSHQAYSVFD